MERVKEIEPRFLIGVCAYPKGEDRSPKYIA